MDVANVTEPLAAENVSERRATFVRQIVRRLLADPSATAGALLFGLMVVLAVLAPLIARYLPNDIDLSELNQGPTSAHWFGTDYLGRDMWSRVLYGGRTSLP